MESVERKVEHRGHRFYVNPLLGYKLAWFVGLTVTTPVWAYAAVTDRWQVRRRLLPRSSDDTAPMWWWHGASAGEVRGLVSLLEAVERTDNNVIDRVSATTESGLAMWRTAGYDPTVAPIDLPYAVRRALPRNLRLAVLSETELWPTLIDEIAERGVPIVIASARMSERSMVRLRMTRILRANTGTLFVCAQTEGDAQRYRELGVLDERIAVTGSLKWPTHAPAERESVRHRFGLAPKIPCIVAGSIRRDEIDIVVKALARLRSDKPNVTAIVAPRRLSDVFYAQQRLRDAGFEVTPYDSFANSDATAELRSCTVVDTMGELAALYAAADMAVVGGGWEPVGGHNPFEAAVYRIPVAYGPYMRQPGTELLEVAGQAVRAVDENALADAMRNGLSVGTFDTVAWPDPVAATFEAWRRWGIV